MHSISRDRQYWRCPVEVWRQPRSRPDLVA